MIVYNLNKNISAEKIINDINQLVSRAENLPNKVLVIKLQDITDYSGDSLLPKLCFNPETNDS